MITIGAFADIFAALAVQLRQTDMDEATIRVYFDSLKDIEIEWLSLAATRLSSSSQWFPKTSEWRTMAGQIEKERRAEQRERLRKLPAPLCDKCSDTGWEELATTPRRAAPCGCQQQRRLELLGRRPWPALPEHEGPRYPDIHQQAEATVRQIAARRAIPERKPRPRRPLSAQHRALDIVLQGIVDQTAIVAAAESADDAEKKDAS